MATIVKTEAGTWKALVRKTGWPTNTKTFRTKRDAEDWARRTEDEMVRGVYIQRSGSERMTLEKALERYLAEVTPSKKPTTRKAETALFFAEVQSRFWVICEIGNRSIPNALNRLIDHMQRH